MKIKGMNITQESEDYYQCRLQGNTFKDIAESNLKDKLKTTPDRGIKRVRYSFKVDWNKLFKRR